MSDPILVLYSQNHWRADGTQTTWNFTFADGYIDKAYVKAYYQIDDVKTYLTLTSDNFTGPFQLHLTPAVPDGAILVVYRDTPKSAPLVNYSTGSNFTEGNLDESNRQCIHCVAELADLSGLSLDLDTLGFKALQHVTYTDASVVALLDNGRSHFKTDGTPVTVPNTLPVSFLSTIVNHSAFSMTVGFDDGAAILQGSGSSELHVSLVLDPFNTLSISKMEDGIWYASGSAS